MNRFKLSKIAGAGILSLSLAVMPLVLPVSAQTDTGSPQTNTESNGPTVDSTPLQETKNDQNNFGWLGLLGLIGLANFFRNSDRSAVDRR
jgi:hypothetical protein